MKNKLKLFVICILIITTTTSCDSKSNNKKAKEMFLKNMTLLKRSVNGRDFILEDTSKAIKEMEELTSIPSKTHGNYIGKISPTQGDLIVWESWYKVNQDKLYWDEENHKIKVKLE